MDVDIVRVSAKGQIAIPVDMRNALSISDGDGLAVFATDEVIVLRPLKLPTAKEFSRWLKEAQTWAKKAGYTEDDMSGIIKSVRIRKRKRK